MKTFLADCKTALLLTVVLVLLCCGAYPVVVWAGAQAFFPHRANGSLIVDAAGSVRGSRLLAQNFADAKDFASRPSAAGSGYDSISSGGTNLGPTSAKLAHGSHAKDAHGNAVDDPGNFDGIGDLVVAYRSANGLASTVAVPADAVTRSASGLDPHISVANAQIQAVRVARTRGLTLAAVQALIRQNTAERDGGVLGEAGVNVLMLNLALDRGAAAR
jgi:K+-transporting ATPase ATPase C chain